MMENYPAFQYWAERVVRACRDLVGAEAGCVSLLGARGKEMTIVFSASAGAQCSADSLVSDPVRRLRNSARRTGRAVYRNDIAARKGRVPFPKGAAAGPKGAAGIRSAMFAPMMVEGRIAGLLGLFNKPGGFDDEDAQTALLFGEIASVALQNDRALGTLRQSERTLGDAARRAGGCSAAVRAVGEARSAVERQMRDQTEKMLVSAERLTRETEERRKTEHALRESETKYRIISDNAYDWEWWISPDGRFIHMSPSCTRITGHDPAEFSGELDLVEKIVHPDDRPVFAAHRAEVDRTLEGGSVEFRIVRPDGTHRWVSHACQPVFDETGRFLGHRGSNRDVTERKEAEEALRRSEETLRELSTQLLRAQEEGRKRVARELHDGVNQTLTAIKFALESRLSHMPTADAAPGTSFEKIVSLVQHAIDETRRIQMDLRPPLLDDLGILATLSWFTREFENVYSHIRVERDIETSEEDVPHLLKIVIFRIVQEALNNVAKHSRATLATVRLRSVGGGIELAIEDDGRGFDLDTPSRGFGLMNMRERAELSGGTFEIQSSSGRGTSIRAYWPPRQW